MTVPVPPSPALITALKGIVAKAGWKQTPAPAGSAVARGYVLRDAVLGSFASWSTMFEGALLFMYTDVKGLVTTGIGNLIDPMTAALALPWANPDGSPASQADIEAAWSAVKRAFPGRQSVACGPLTTIRLTRAGVQQLVEDKLLANDKYLATHLPGYATAPADAQLAANGMAWAMGPGFISTFTNFARCFSAGDYAAAAEACEINSRGNPGVVPRNTADVVLLNNAALVAAGQGSPDILYFLDPVTSLPSELPTGQIPVPADAYGDTIPPPAPDDPDATKQP